MTVIYTPIGYGVTDENGQCTLDHDVDGNPLAHSYTGSGAGKVDIVASLDSEIDESSLVSETFVLMDCLVYDGGINTNHYDNWYNYGNRLTPSNPDADGRLLENNSSYNGYYYAILNGDTPSDANSYKFDTFTLECDVVNRSETIDSNGFVFYDGNTQQYISTDWLCAYDGDHLKITYNGSQFTMESDNSSPYTFSKSFTGKLRLGFQIQPNGFLKYKNFKLYPI